MAHRFLTAALAGVVIAEVLYVVDVLTHGAALRNLQRVARDAVAYVEHERDVQRGARWVVFEAIEATREAAAHE